MKIFILEDEIDREPRIGIVRALARHELHLARCKDEAIDLYPKHAPYDLLLLDHDMRGYFDDSNYHNTGFQFVMWLTHFNHSLGAKLPGVILHSQNCLGRSNMERVLTKHGYQVSEQPFCPSYIKLLKDVYGEVK